MHVVSVVGARPQFVKLAAMATAFERAGTTHTIVHTGQHYDPNMSEVFFADLAIPTADVNLGVGSASHAAQTAAMLTGLEEHFSALCPDWVLTYGDTNSTIAAALAAVKLHLPTAHLEAGLRSFNRRMPEEHNRVLTDHASDLLLAPSRVAMDNLAREGLSGRAVHVGDVMVDIALLVQRGLTEHPVELPADMEGEFIVATIHRAESTDDPDRLAKVVRALAAMPVPVFLPAHPRLRGCADRQGLDLHIGALRVIDPMPYRAMVAAVTRARAVVTDSGGLQKEAFVLGTPCTTVRTETEWTETVDLGWNQLVAFDDLDTLAEVALRPTPSSTTDMPYGRGDAADQSVAVLARAT